MKYKVNNFIIDAKSPVTAMRLAKAMSFMKDADYSYLTEEEQKAVNDYRQAIQSTTNPEVLRIFSHILQEELDHIEELKQAESMEDSMKDVEPLRNIKVLKQQTSDLGRKYSLLEADLGSHHVWVVTSSYSGGTEANIGGSVSFNKSDAEKTFNDFLIMEHLEKKYGQREGYKKWMKGERDSMASRYRTKQ